MFGVECNLNKLRVEYPHQPAVPSDPYSSSKVFRRRRVIRLVHLDVTVLVDDALSFVKEWKPPLRQRQQGWFLYRREDFADLLLGCAVNAEGLRRGSPSESNKHSVRPAFRRRDHATRFLGRS